MAVVINEFEVIAEPAPYAFCDVPEGSDAEPAVWTAHDIEEIVRRQRERDARPGRLNKHGKQQRHP